jgi:hypothetical protein
MSQKEVFVGDIDAILNKALVDVKQSIKNNLINLS